MTMAHRIGQQRLNLGWVGPLGLEPGDLPSPGREKSAWTRGNRGKKKGHILTTYSKWWEHISQNMSKPSTKSRNGHIHVLQMIYH
jgi:hypothetical protein